MGKRSFLRNSNYRRNVKSILLIKMFLELVEMMLGLVYASFSLPESQALNRASDISRKKKQNFAGFSGANSRKNRPISRHFHGKKVKIRGTIGRFREIFTGEKSKFAEKSAHFAGFLWEKSQFSKDFRGQILRKIGRFHGKFRGETSPTNNQ